MFSDQYNPPASRNAQPGASPTRTQRRDAPVVTQNSRQFEIYVKQFAINLNYTNSHLALLSLPFTQTIALPAYWPIYQHTLQK